MSTEVDFAQTFVHTSGATDMGRGGRSNLGISVNDFPGPGTYTVTKPIHNYHSHTSRNNAGKKISLTVQNTENNEAQAQTLETKKKHIPRSPDVEKMKE